MNYQGADLATFPNQIEFAISEFKPEAVAHLKGKIDHIVICGLGGSGIAGRITKAYFQSTCSINIDLVADYTLPANVTKDSLIICSSYSGNTEETLTCFHKALEIGSPVICITGGGQLADLATANNFPLFKAVHGLQPRMALGYSLTYLLLIVQELSGQAVLEHLEACLPKLKEPKWHQDKGTAFIDALDLTNEKFLQIVSDGPCQAMAVRLQQQLNENSKIWGQVHEMPEMCHNVIEAITNDNLKGPWLLLNSQTNDRNNKRFDYLSNLLTEKGYPNETMHFKANELSELLDGIFIYDWVSILIAHAHGKDSSQIPNIKGLKAYLS